MSTTTVTVGLPAGTPYVGRTEAFAELYRRAVDLAGGEAVQPLGGNRLRVPEDVARQLAGEDPAPARGRKATATGVRPVGPKRGAQPSTARRSSSPAPAKPAGPDAGPHQPHEAGGASPPPAPSPTTPPRTTQEA